LRTYKTCCIYTELSSSNQKNEPKAGKTVSQTSGPNRTTKTANDESEESDGYDDDDFEEIDEESIAMSVEQSLSVTSSPTHTNTGSSSGPSKHHNSSPRNMPHPTTGALLSPSNSLPALKEKALETSNEYADESYGSASFSRSSVSPKNVLSQSVSHYSDVCQTTTTTHSDMLVALSCVSYYFEPIQYGH
jgi:hypothetical protein